MTIKQVCEGFKGCLDDFPSIMVGMNYLGKEFCCFLPLPGADAVSISLSLRLRVRVQIKVFLDGTWKEGNGGR